MRKKTTYYTFTVEYVQILHPFLYSNCCLPAYYVAAGFWLSNVTDRKRVTPLVYTALMTVLLLRTAAVPACVLDVVVCDLLTVFSVR